MIMEYELCFGSLTSQTQLAVVVIVLPALAPNDKFLVCTCRSSGRPWCHSDTHCRAQLIWRSQSSDDPKVCQSYSLPYLPLVSFSSFSFFLSLSFSHSPQCWSLDWLTRLSWHLISSQWVHSLYTFTSALHSIIWSNLRRRLMHMYYTSVTVYPP